MKKYFILFAISSCFGITTAMAQTPAATSTGQSAVITDTPPADNSSKGTITKAGKNEQSVYTPPASADTNAPSTATPVSQQASPVKEQPAVIDPKKRN